MAIYLAECFGWVDGEDCLQTQQVILQKKEFIP